MKFSINWKLVGQITWIGFLLIGCFCAIGNCIDTYRIMHRRDSATPPAVTVSTVNLPPAVAAAISQFTNDLDNYTAVYGTLQTDQAALAAAQTAVNNDQAATNSAQAAVANDETAIAQAVATAFGQPTTPTPAPTPSPTPTPTPTPTPPTPVATSNLRVLFSYDPMQLGTMPEAQQQILTSPTLRNYLSKHCPLESGCANGQCPLTAQPSPSYRFLPVNADTSKLTPVWQTVAKAVAGKPGLWMTAIDTSGKTVIDQAWPADVASTLALLQKYGGP